MGEALGFGKKGLMRREWSKREGLHVPAAATVLVSAAAPPPPPDRGATCAARRSMLRLLAAGGFETLLGVRTCAAVGVVLETAAAPKAAAEAEGGTGEGDELKLGESPAGRGDNPPPGVWAGEGLMPPEAPAGIIPSLGQD